MFHWKFPINPLESPHLINQTKVSYMKVSHFQLSNGFTTPSNTLEFAQRATRINRVGEVCNLVAFGSATINGLFRARQVSISQPLLNRDNCAFSNTTMANRISERMICATSDRNAAPCGGNLGSGLYCNGIFTGVLTNGLTCGAGTAIYQQIRAYNNWIVQTMGLPEGNAPGSVPFDVRGFPIARWT